jgi:hypothetical protein
MGPLGPPTTSLATLQQDGLKHTVFSYIVYVALLIATLLVVGMKDHPNTAHTFLFMQIGCIILYMQFCSNNSSIHDDVSISKHLGATCSGFPFVAEQVAHTFHCTTYMHH